MTDPASQVLPEILPHDLLITKQVGERPRRPINPRREAEVARELSGLMLTDPRAAVGRFLDLAIELCGAGSAGLSLLGLKDDAEVFHWTALAGEYAAHVGGTTPRHFSPCGLCIEAGRTIALSWPGRVFSYFNAVDPPIVEGLIVPLYDGEQHPLGTLWVVHHDERRGFCPDDVRIMESLAVQLALALKLVGYQANATDTVRDLQRRAAEADILRADNEALLESKAFLASVLGSSTDCIKVLDLMGRLVFMNEGGLKVMEVEDFETLKRRPWAEFWSGEAHATAIQALATARRGASTHFQGAAATAKGNVRHWDVEVTPIMNGTDATHILVTSRDITERKHADEQRETLARELEHRIKNILAMVSAIARQTLRPPVDLREAARMFDARLAALGQAQSILTRTEWTGADLGTVVAAVLAPFRVTPDDRRLAADGPLVMLDSHRALSLAMAVHELATNAVKYGALTRPEGRVSLRWSIDRPPAGPMLRLEWREAGGPPVKPPGRKGFGSRLIEQVLPADFAGTVRIEYATAGLTFELSAPVGDSRAPVASG